MSDETSHYQEAGSSKGKAKDVVLWDETYYISGAFVVFQVEDRLFRLPSYLFSNESEIFQGLFLLPQGNPTEIEIASTSDPIILPEERSQDFRSLVKALYPKTPSAQLYLSSSEWLSVLKLATKWYFLRLREIAINELERLHELTSVEKVTFGRQYKVSSWVVQGFQELVNRKTSISDEEAVELDSDNVTTAYKVYRAREGRMLRSFVSVEEEIERVFKGELEAIRADQSGYNSA
ncbi:hypothetical protein CPB84DRAFT_1842118 [Gymnopilus junonius]|uniref:BTB domain-containing protein n=1 Tax=Gymnopilus junonius TaxID=109634 RepID=A0A9P5TUL6_GYMJU|nr:hypothetical protein CPB84DRAFT_1842118 [Gymnopilus junonius]